MAKIKRITERDAAGNILTDYHPGATRSLITDHSSLAAAPRRPGLGDLAATFAKPVAAAIDAITERMLSDEHKTALEKCPACARRHTKWNLLCPDILTCPFIGVLLSKLPEWMRKPVLDAAEKYANHSKPNVINEDPKT